jgi:ribosomal-protein-alanine N-acetyltransferase
LREFEPSDWRAVHAYASDPETVKYLDWGPNAESDTKAFINQAVAWQSSKPRTHYELAITLRKTGELIGGCGIEKRPARKDGVIGYCLNRAHWNKGYATEAVRALIDFGFSRLVLHRITAMCDPLNVGSNRVLEKSGMTLEGHLREDFPVRGGWQDTMVYGILEHEWKSHRSARNQQTRVSREVEKFLLGRDTCRIASVGRDGRPHCVPVGYYYDKGLVYIATNSASAKVENLRSNPNCCVLVDVEKKKGAKGVMLRGTAKVISGKAFPEMKSHLESISGWHLGDWELGPPPRDKVDAFIVFTPEKISTIGRI